MKAPTRRKFVGLLGGTLTVSLAGCGDIQDGEFIIVSTLLQQHPESDNDVQVRVEIENRRSDSVPARLTVTLERDTGDGEPETRTMEMKMEVPKGLSRTYNFRFRSVVTGEFDRDEFTAEAELKER